jgi:hypothetical protein
MQDFYYNDNVFGGDSNKRMGRAPYRQDPGPKFRR